jgi:hypothetical protein
LRPVSWLASDFVAQIVNLLYRRLLIGETTPALNSWTASGWSIRDPADCQSALQAFPSNDLEDCQKLICARARSK